VKKGLGNKLAQIEFEGRRFEEKAYDYSVAYGVKEQAIVIESPAGNSQEMVFKITRGNYETGSD
jgi:hypothetical protein